MSRFSADFHFEVNYSLKKNIEKNQKAIFFRIVAHEYDYLHLAIVITVNRTHLCLIVASVWPGNAGARG